MAFSWKGLAEIRRNLAKIREETPGKIERALYAEAQIEMTEAKKRTPVWNPRRNVPPGHTPGSLRASGMVHEPERDGREISVDLSFGNELVDYAVYVHEDLEADHATGQAKFLESVINESAPYMAERLARHIKFEE